MRRTLFASGVWGIAVSVLLAGAARAQLDPPIGPIVKTGKLLIEIEPRTVINATNTPGDADSIFRINQPGSYYLTGNIAGVAGKHGIEIAANNVTLDLMGFELVGVAGSLDGVSSDGNLVRTVGVQNGVIRDWGQNGVSLAGFFHRASGLAVSGCAQSGIAFALNARIESCRASACGADGFRVGDNAVIRESESFGNTQSGVKAGSGSLVESCLAQGNAFRGFDVADRCSIRDCIGKENTSDNYFISGGGVIAGCVATGSSGSTGIRATGSISVSDCTTEGNFVDGIAVGSGSVVRGCASSTNGQVGIDAGFHSTVSECTAYNNGRDGIRTSIGCYIVKNMCVGNGTDPNALSRAGIWANAAGTRIEDNNCYENAIGIQTFNGGGIIVRNTCRGSTVRNWDIAAGSRCLVINSVAAGAITGNSGGTSLGSTDPNANFTY